MVRQNHLHFHKECNVPGINPHYFVKNKCFKRICDKLGKTADLEKSFHPVLYDRISEPAIIEWGMPQFGMSRFVSGHIQGTFVPNSDHGYRRIWLKNAIFALCLTWIARSFSMFFGSTCYIASMTVSHLVRTSFSWTDAVWKALW